MGSLRNASRFFSSPHHAGTSGVNAHDHTRPARARSTTHSTDLLAGLSEGLASMNG